MHVLAQAGMIGLVENRQIDLGEVDPLGFELAVLLGVGMEPFADCEALAAGTGADGDHGEF